MPLHSPLTRAVWGKGYTGRNWRPLGRDRSEERMAKHSKRERERRAQETERVREIEGAWLRSLPAATAQAFAASVKAARERPPRERPADMAPGTQPRPPRPGHEPRPPKDAPRSGGRER
jgi:hypothetical protein